MEEHPSIPFNPDIAAAFFRAGLIEAWGRGTLKIVRECREAGLPAPIFTYDLSGFRIEFKKEAGKSSEKSSDEIRCSIFPFPLFFLPNTAQSPPKNESLPARATRRPIFVSSNSAQRYYTIQKRLP